jgi:type I restriction enzyme M protein
VTAQDEWCAEAYMETDYSMLTKADFEKTVRDYAIYKLSLETVKVPS